MNQMIYQRVYYPSFSRFLLPLFCLFSARVIGLGAQAATARSLAPLAQPPAITTQPQNQTVAVGATATFSVTADGTTPLSYQWRRNASDLPGAANSTLVLVNVQPTNGGLYSVRVGNAAGSITSADATLIIQTPPTIVMQPRSQTVAIGWTAIFSVGSVGTGPFQFQWRLDGRDIVGATNFVLVLRSAQLSDVGDYTVRVSNALGSVTSDAARLVLTDPPTVLVQPQGQKVAIGGTATFNATVTGGLPLRYQWLFDGRELPAATNATLVIGNVQLANTGFYSVRVSIAGSFVMSSAVRLSFDVPGEAPTITQQPIGQIMEAAGMSVTLFVAATGTPPLQYQWRLEEQDLIGATNEFLVLTNFQASDAGHYSVRVSNAAGGVGSTVVKVALIGPPTITGQPADRTVTLGSTAFFNVSAAGTGPITYQWRFNGNDLVGATNSYLSLTNVQPANAGLYSVQVTGRGGSTNTTEARLTIFIPGVFPTVTWLPSNFVAPVSTNVVLAVMAAGAPPLHFQWLRNGQELPGATNSILVLTNVQPVNAGFYSVKVSNTSGTATSPPMPLIILASGSFLIQRGFVIRLGGPPGASVQLQVSTNLSTWTTLTRLTCAAEPIEYRDADARENGPRFYRALIGP